MENPSQSKQPTSSSFNPLLLFSPVSNEDGGATPNNNNNHHHQQNLTKNTNHTGTNNINTVKSSSRTTTTTTNTATDLERNQTHGNTVDNIMTDVSNGGDDKIESNKKVLQGMEESCNRRQNGREQQQSKNGSDKNNNNYYNNNGAITKNLNGNNNVKNNKNNNNNNDNDMCTLSSALLDAPHELTPSHGPVKMVHRDHRDRDDGAATASRPTTIDIWSGAGGRGMLQSNGGTSLATTSNEKYVFSSQTGLSLTNNRTMSQQRQQQHPHHVGSGVFGSSTPALIDLMKRRRRSLSQSLASISHASHSTLIESSSKPHNVILELGKKIQKVTNADPLFHLSWTSVGTTSTTVGGGGAQSMLMMAATQKALFDPISPLSPLDAVKLLSSSKSSAFFPHHNNSLIVSRQQQQQHQKVQRANSIFSNFLTSNTNILLAQQHPHPLRAKAEFNTSLVDQQQQKKPNQQQQVVEDGLPHQISENTGEEQRTFQENYATASKGQRRVTINDSVKISLPIHLISTQQQRQNDDDDDNDNDDQGHNPAKKFDESSQSSQRVKIPSSEGHHNNSTRHHHSVAFDFSQSGVTKSISEPSNSLSLQQHSHHPISPHHIGASRRRFSGPDSVRDSGCGGDFLLKSFGSLLAAAAASTPTSATKTATTKTEPTSHLLQQQRQQDIQLYLAQAAAVVLGDTSGNIPKMTRKRALSILRPSFDVHNSVPEPYRNRAMSSSLSSAVLTRAERDLILAQLRNSQLQQGNNNNENEKYNFSPLLPRSVTPFSRRKIRNRTRKSSAKSKGGGGNNNNEEQDDCGDDNNNTDDEEDTSTRLEVLAGVTNSLNKKPDAERDQGPPVFFSPSGEYHGLRQLGRGTFGDAWLVEWKPRARTARELKYEKTLKKQAALVAELQKKEEEAKQEQQKEKLRKKMAAGTNKNNENKNDDHGGAAAAADVNFSSQTRNESLINNNKNNNIDENNNSKINNKKQTDIERALELDPPSTVSMVSSYSNMRMVGDRSIPASRVFVCKVAHVEDYDRTYHASEAHDAYLKKTEDVVANAEKHRHHHQQQRQQQMLQQHHIAQINLTSFSEQQETSQSPIVFNINLRGDISKNTCNSSAGFLLENSSKSPHRTSMNNDNAGANHRRMNSSNWNQQRHQDRDQLRDRGDESDAIHPQMSLFHIAQQQQEKRSKCSVALGQERHGTLPSQSGRDLNQAHVRDVYQPNIVVSVTAPSHHQHNHHQSQHQYHNAKNALELYHILESDNNLIAPNKIGSGVGESILNTPTNQQSQKQNQQPSPNFGNNMKNNGNVNNAFGTTHHNQHQHRPLFLTPRFVLASRKQKSTITSISPAATKPHQKNHNNRINDDDDDGLLPSCIKDHIGGDVGVVSEIPRVRSAKNLTSMESQTSSRINIPDERKTPENMTKFATMMHDNNNNDESTHEDKKTTSSATAAAQGKGNENNNDNLSSQQKQLLDQQRQQISILTGNDYVNIMIDKIHKEPATPILNDPTATMISANNENNNNNNTSSSADVRPVQSSNAVDETATSDVDEVFVELNHMKNNSNNNNFINSDGLPPSSPMPGAAPTVNQTQSPNANDDEQIKKEQTTNPPSQLSSSTTATALSASSSSSSIADHCDSDDEFLNSAVAHGDIEYVVSPFSSRVMHHNKHCREDFILSNCAYPLITAYVESFYSTDSRLHLIMEYVSGGTLRNEMDRCYQKGNNYFLPERTVCFLVVQILLALEYLHARNIVHRDLKASNILLSRRYIIKLADFGLSAQLEDGAGMLEPGTPIGTPEYISPETYVRSECGPKSDVWAVGIILYQLMTYEKPFFGESHEAIRRAIVMGAYPPLQLKRPDASADMLQLMEAMLRRNPEKRFTARQVLGLPSMQRAMTDFMEHFSGVVKESNPVCECDLQWEKLLKEHTSMLMNPVPENTSSGDKNNKNNNGSPSDLPKDELSHSSPIIIDDRRDPTKVTADAQPPFVVTWTTNLPTSFDVRQNRADENKNKKLSRLFRKMREDQNKAEELRKKHQKLYLEERLRMLESESQSQPMTFHHHNKMGGGMKNQQQQQRYDEYQSLASNQMFLDSLTEKEGQQHSQQQRRPLGMMLIGGNNRIIAGAEQQQQHPRIKTNPARTVTTATNGTLVGRNSNNNNNNHSNHNSNASSNKIGNSNNGPASASDGSSFPPQRNNNMNVTDDHQQQTPRVIATGRENDDNDDNDNDTTRTSPSNKTHTIGEAANTPSGDQQTTTTTKPSTGSLITQGTAKDSNNNNNNNNDDDSQRHHNYSNSDQNNISSNEGARSLLEQSNGVVGGGGGKANDDNNSGDAAAIIARRRKNNINNSTLAPDHQQQQQRLQTNSSVGESNCSTNGKSILMTSPGSSQQEV